MKIESSVNIKFIDENYIDDSMRKLEVFRHLTLERIRKIVEIFTNKFEVSEVDINTCRNSILIKTQDIYPQLFLIIKHEITGIGLIGFQWDKLVEVNNA